MMGRLALPSRVGTIGIVGEPHDAFGSADHLRAYPEAIDLGAGRYRPSSVHGISIDGVPLIVVGASGGATCVHERSALTLWDRLYLAVGDRVACFTLDPFALERSVEADDATCFGLHDAPDHDALICHGELSVTRLRKNLDIVWCGRGRDIFTGAFRLAPAFVEAHDWDDTRYRFDYETGADLEPLRPPQTDPHRG